MFKMTNLWVIEWKASNGIYLEDKIYLTDESKSGYIIML